jgi:signal peptidase I
MNPDVILRRGSWAIFAMGSLYLVAAFMAPVAGVTLAALFFALGWGMRRRQIWAATAASVALMAPVFLQLRNYQAGFAWVVSLAIQVAIAWLPVWATVTLWRHREIARFGRGWLALAVVLVLAAAAIRPYRVPSAGMANTIVVGDSILAESLSWKLGRAPRAGDVVEFRYPIDHNEIFIKRVVGVPGDRIRIVNKQLYRNGVPVNEPYAIHASPYVDSYRDNFPSAPNDQSLPPSAADMLQNHIRNGEVVVPPGKYFVMGDNRDNSLDSRYWGFVSRAEITASPLMIYASYNVPAEHPEVTGSILNTRWNRLLKIL